MSTMISPKLSCVSTTDPSLVTSSGRVCLYKMVPSILGSILLFIILVIYYGMGNRHVTALASRVDHLSNIRFTWNDFRCNACNNFTYDYLIRNADFCREDGEIFILFLVMSGHNYTPERDGIRQTWATLRNYNNKQLRTLFVLGRGTPRENAALNAEAKKYGDIIQGDFSDSYRTLTEKVMFGLTWVRDNCAHARYVVKTDDDMFHVPWRYVEHLSTVTADRYIAGRCVAVMPYRDPALPKYVSPDIYPHLYSPYFCLGGGYIMSQAAIRVLLRVAPNVPYLPMEDQFVVGLCRVMGKIPYKQIGGILNQKVTPCFIAKRSYNIHRATPALMREMWAIAQSSDACKDTYLTKHSTSGLTIFVAVCFVLVWIKFIIGIMYSSF